MCSSQRFCACFRRTLAFMGSARCGGKCSVKAFHCSIDGGQAYARLGYPRDERGSALILTGVGRHNSISDYFLGTAVDHLIRTTMVPVLVVKQRPHAPYSTLLVAMDLSSCSRKALIRAGEMFTDAALHIVHAFHVPYEGCMPSDEVHAKEQAQRALDAFVRDTQIPAGIRGRLQAHLGYGETSQVVAKALQETVADLVATSIACTAISRTEYEFASKGLIQLDRSSLFAR